MLVRKLQKQGNQLVVNLPKQVVTDFGWKKGDLIRFEIVARNVIQISKVEIPQSGIKGRPILPGNREENLTS